VKVLLTGASGFVGSHLVRHLLMNTDWELVAPVSFRHKGLAARIESSVCDVPGGSERVRLLHWDLTTPADHLVMRELEGCEVILNVASESHVDRSIEWPNQFISNNVSLVLNVLEVARHLQPRLVLQMSTDEVYGPAYGSHLHREWETIAPSNPYSASKAAQEAICFSYWRTYDLPIVITNTMNIIGEMQERVSFHASRPGHDLRYALDGSKLQRLGWTAPVPYLPALRRTVEWYLAHPEWLLLG
jgi:dTDP-glucose 4,6-dehydratase